MKLKTGVVIRPSLITFIIYSAFLFTFLTNMTQTIREGLE